MQSILGQSRALNILRDALASDRFHHAWIFSGPRGVGKFTAAVEVARFLLDQQAMINLKLQRESSESDRSESENIAAIKEPQSKMQTLIDSRTHPDLHIIRKEMAAYSDDRQLRERKQLNIPIDLLRERIIGGKVGETMHDAAAYRTAFHGHGKVFIIDEAELLDPNAQNAMLKTLEEPPAHTYFFLITSRPERLLPTIRSRCQHVRFGSLDVKSMKRWMKSSIKDAPSSDALNWIENFANGSPGTAQLAIEFGFYNWQQRLSPMLAELEHGNFPQQMGDTMAGLIEEFAQAWVVKHGKKTTSKDAANKSGAGHLFTLLAAHLRDEMAQSVSRDDDVSRIVAMIDLLHDAERQLDSNVNLKLLLENLVVQWAQTAHHPATL